MYDGKLTLDETWRLICDRVSSKSPLLKVSRTALREVLAPAGLCEKSFETIFKTVDLKEEVGTIHMGLLYTALKEVVGG